MKTLFKLLLPLLIVGLLISCSDNPSGNVDEFEQYYIGDFLVYSEMGASYKGTQAKPAGNAMSADTILIQDDIGFSFEIYRDTVQGPEAFRVEFVDSNSIGWPEIDRVELEFQEQPAGFNYNRREGEIDPEFIRINFSAYYRCYIPDTTTLNDFSAKAYNEQDSLITVYQFDAEGAADVFRDLGCS